MFGNLNLNIFKSTKTQCNKIPNEIPITERCTHLKRLCTAMRYHDALTTSKLTETQTQNTFVSFNEDIYGLLIDDTAHLIDKHSEDLTLIQSEWIEKYGFPSCPISDCIKTARHYTRDRRESHDNQRKETGTNTLYTFYESLYDRVHHFIFHLYDIGLRVDTKSLIKEIGDENKEDDLKGVTVDKLFAATQDVIQSKKKQSKIKFDRLEGENNKFTITQSGGTAVTATITLMDALFERLLRDKETKKEMINPFWQFLKGNDYDSDALEVDLESGADSNIYREIQNEFVMKEINEFIRITKLRRRSFSTGFVFNYWKNEPFNAADVKQQYPSDAIIVQPFYKSLKEEVIGSGLLEMTEWTEVVMLKASKYLKSDKVRGFIAGQAEYGTITGQIQKGEPVSLNHIVAVILYCDSTTLCTAFSATFRIQNVFESLESLVLRHSKFYHFSRLLVEIVLDFGTNSVGRTSKIKSFFCGIDRKLHFGNYAIHLKGPCSTSTAVSVAINFAKSGGLILKLRNDAWHMKWQTFLDCAFLSNYFEEAEKLWIAGRHPVRIVSILMIENAKNYAKLIRGLFLFDAMISGVDMDGSKIKERRSDRKFISRLIENTLDGNAGGNTGGLTGFDPYVANEWQLFIQNKKEIVLLMYSIKWNFKILSKLIMSNVVDTFDAMNSNKTLKETDNALKPEWLSLFPSLETLKIITKGNRFAFRLDVLLRTIKQISPNLVVIIDEVDGSKWTRKAMNDELKALYRAAGWNVEYDKHYQGWYNQSGAMMIKPISMI